jgi:outer membrane protein assembly factor BamB
MKTSELVFIGIKGSVIALKRETGEQVWATSLKGIDFVNVVIEDDIVYATTSGEIYRLDPATGDGLWHNELKGFGRGLATIATSQSIKSGSMAAMSEKRRRDEQAAASSAAIVPAITS